MYVIKPASLRAKRQDHRQALRGCGESLRQAGAAPTRPSARGLAQRMLLPLYFYDNINPLSMAQIMG